MSAYLEHRVINALIHRPPNVREILAARLRDLRHDGQRQAARDLRAYAVWVGYPSKL